jgi:hypothetical protein
VIASCRSRQHFWCGIDGAKVVPLKKREVRTSGSFFTSGVKFCSVTLLKFVKREKGRREESHAPLIPRLITAHLRAPVSEHRRSHPQQELHTNFGSLVRPNEKSGEQHLAVCRFLKFSSWPVKTYPSWLALTEILP